jgi:parallel beta-helix repeat protein
MLLCALLISAAFAFFGPDTVVTDVSAEIVEGDGNCFEITNSTYLNVTLCSSEVVNVSLESIPDVVSFTIQAVANVTSTSIDLSGFVPNGTYYRHEDGYLKESFVADEAGNYSYTQDLTTPHHVFIAEEAGTKYIQDTTNGGHCYLIGSWDGPTKTCTLTTNVYEMVVLDSSELTLDGDGWAVSVSSSYGVYAYGKSGLAVKNVIVTAPSYGIYLRSSSGSTVSGNTVSGGNHNIALILSSGSTVSGNAVSGGRYGIDLSSSSGSTVSGNTVSASGLYSVGIHVSNSGGSVASGNTVSSGYYSMRLSSSSGVTVSGNTLSGGQYGILLLYCNGNTVSGNTFSSDRYGVYLHTSGMNSVTGNTFTGGTVGIFVYISPSTTLSDNAMNSGGVAVSGDSLSHWNTHTIDATNTVGGKPVQYCKDTTGGTIPSGAGQVILAGCSDMIVENQDIGNVLVGIVVAYGSGNTIRWSTVAGTSSGVLMRSSGSSMVTENTISGGSRGVSLQSSSGSTLVGNIITSGRTAVSLSSSGSSTVTANTLTGGNIGIYLVYSDSSTLTGNSITVSGDFGIWVVRSTYIVLADNAMNRGGITIEASSYSQWNTHTIDATNTVGGKPVQYCKDTTGETIPSGAGQVILVGCSDITVENQTISDVHTGIVVVYGSGNAIRWNTVTGSFNGIYIHSSTSSMVTENAVSSSTYGVEVYSSGGSTISRNTVAVAGSWGIRLVSSGSSTVTENDVSGSMYGIDLISSSGSTVTENTVTSGSCGIELRYSGGSAVMGNTVTTNGNYGIRIDSSSGSTVAGNSVSVIDGQYSYGIHISPAGGSTVTSNSVAGGEYGIRLSSGDGTIIGNTVVGSVYGIYFYSISTSTISGNTVTGNTYGFYLASSNTNAIFHNNFIDNTYQHHSQASTNTWNDPANEGNYWSDYIGLDDGSGGRIPGDGIGDTNLPHQGVDWYPLMLSWNNPPEILTVSGPDLVQIGDVVAMTGTFVDYDLGDTHTALWSWNDGSPDSAGVVLDGTVTGSHQYVSAGVYTVVLTVADSHDATDTMQYQYVVIYDPHGAFVTGGGWFGSPPGAYAWGPGLTGKATFGFVAKYLHGSSIPTGQTEFRFQLADISFTSDSYEWLVCGGPKCKFKGQGTFTIKWKWGGPWDQEYNVRFMITVIDGSLPGGGGEDKFRIKIWNPYTEFVYYDNMRGYDDEAEPPAIGGGKIVIHKG